VPLTHWVVNSDIVLALIFLIAILIIGKRQTLRGSRILEGGDMFYEHEKFISWAAQYDEWLRGGRSLPLHKNAELRQAVNLNSSLKLF
jgi:hypothetical protein